MYCGKKWNKSKKLNYTSDVLYVYCKWSQYIPLIKSTLFMFIGTNLTYYGLIFVNAQIELLGMSYATYLFSYKSLNPLDFPAQGLIIKYSKWAKLRECLCLWIKNNEQKKDISLIWYLVGIHGTAKINAAPQKRSRIADYWQRLEFDYSTQTAKQALNVVIDLDTLF